MAIKSSDCGANAEGGGGFQEGNTCAAGGSDSENKKHEKFLKWFDSQGWDHPFMRGARAWGLKHEDGTEGTVYVKMYPSVNKDAVHISEIFAHPTGKGFGTAILERITEEADKQGVTLDLSAVPFGEDKMPSQDLIEYYRKHGFRPRGKGFAEDELVRKPKKKSKSFGVAVIKSSDCGANAEGGGGFQTGNTCAAGEGSSKTETREFREWFGDSKVVDEDGRPLVVFHGTNREFNSFSHDAEQQNDAGFAGEGFYFMSSKEWGDGYAEVAVDNSGGEARTIEAYLRIENPKVISDYQEVIKGRDIRESGVARAVAKEIRESGHDGVILMPKKKGGPREYMVLDPVQIKSATNNRGTFDPSDPDITKSFSLKSSDCGANAEGGGGFQIGNTCASKDNKVTESTIGLKGAMNEIEERTGKKFPKDEADQMAHVVSLHEKGKITKTQRDKYFKELERYFEEDMKARGFGAAESMFPAPKNVKVSERATINKGSALKELGLPEDIDVKKLALVAGVGDDAQVSVEYRSKDITFHVTDGYKSQSKLYKDNDGDFVIYNRYMEVKKRGQGLGTEVLQRQVEAASRMGVSKLKGVAVRREGTTGVPLVGYYVWPRLGYDGKLTDLHKKALPKELSEYDPEMVSDLMMSKKGRDWWRANGSTFNVEFDLSKNSWGRKTLERLIRKKREGKE
jgi:GNAT superfamily N-acetyltransferase